MSEPADFAEFVGYLTQFFQQRISQGKPALIGHTPMTPYEGTLVDELAHGESVPEHPSACTSAPFTCWHAQVWHKGRSGRLGPCQVPGCQCLMFVSQRSCHAPLTVPGKAAQ